MCFATGYIGYGKTATQSGTFESWSADLALDGGGYGTGLHGLDMCATADAGQSSLAYWTVDLGKRHQILNITIYKRPGKFRLKTQKTKPY